MKLELVHIDFILTSGFSFILNSHTGFLFPLGRARQHMENKHPKRGLEKFTLKGRSKWGLLVRAFMAAFLVGMLGLVVLVVLISASPATGALGADWLRNLIGNKPVAELEAIVFTIQDKAHQFVYQVEKSTPSAPWDISNPQGVSSAKINTRGSSSIPGVTNNAARNPSKTSLAAENNPLATELPNPTGTPMGAPGSTSGSVFINMPQPADPTTALTPSAVQEAWMPGTVVPLGTIPDEGIWTAYIQDQSGATLSYRTFLQPDSERSYGVVGIVAFDLSHVRLHYQLGTLEPVVAGGSPGTGQIPGPDRLPGTLLAAFNGGFKTVHGHFGVFMDGKVLIPPIDGVGTIAIYKDGSIRIGEWGVDLNYSPDMIVYRQNCPLMIHNGAINPLVFNNSVNDWGGTIGGNIVTFRSGIGISQGGETLYYFAGNSLTMPALAKAMQDAGAYQAMQLDINNYYVYFTKFELQDNQLTAVPLLPKEMIDNISRFLDTYSHDFFYVTASKP
jgi:hypothetical protein